MKQLGLRKLVLLCGIAVLLVVYILQLALTGRQKVRELSFSDEPDSLLIQIGDDASQTVAIVKEDGAWLVGDKKYPASESTVDSLLAAIKDIKLLGEVTGRADDAERYGLHEAGRVLVTASKAGTVLRTLSVGKDTSTKNQSYVQVDGKSQIYLAGGALHGTFATTVAAVRSKAVYALDASAITAVSVSTASADSSLEGNFRIWKEEQASAGTEDGASVTAVAAPVWHLDAQLAEAVELDESKVSSWVNSLASLNVDAWLDDAGSAWTPEIVLTLEAGGTSYTVSLFASYTDAAAGEGEEEPQKQYTASCSETPYCFTLPTYVLPRFQKKLSDLKKEG